MAELRGRGVMADAVRHPEADLRTRELTADRYTIGRIQGSYRHVAEILARCPGLSRDAALDVGCGSGFDTFALAGEFDRVVAIDLNRRALRTARHIAREHHVGRIAFHRQNALVPAPAGPFDLVYCNAMSHGTRSRCQLMHTLVRSTKPGGWLFISEECEGYAPLETEKAILERDYRILRARLRQVMNGILGADAFRFFVSDTLEPVLAGYGGEVTHAEALKWEGLPYLERTWARRITGKAAAQAAAGDYQVLPRDLRQLRDLCRPLVGRRLTADERRRLTEFAESGGRLAPFAIFSLMTEVLDPRLSSKPSLVEKIANRIPVGPDDRPVDWRRVADLFAEFRAAIAVLGPSV